jgi:hypothetical protein
MNEEYNTRTLAVGIIIAVAIVTVTVLALNFGEIVRIVSTEGLING